MRLEIRGGDHATRQINQMMPPGFPCQRLVVVEVYTPGGNWSSYPPHKHDVHTGEPGRRAWSQADLDEIYYYKIDRPEGYALQRIYTGRRVAACMRRAFPSTRPSSRATTTWC